MTYYTGSYEPPIGGVSQQHASARLPTQVERQVNMLSDVVMGVRRRGGFNASPVESSRTVSGMGYGGVELGFVVPSPEVGSLYVQVVVETTNMTVRLRQWDIDAGKPVGDVLTSTVLSGAYEPERAQEIIDVATVGDSVIILDRQRVVQSITPPVTNTPSGWLYIQAGQFKFTYTIQIAGNTYTYTTDSVDPTTGLGDETKITPEYIMTQLLGNITSIPGYTSLQKHQIGGYAYITAVPTGSTESGPLDITTPLSNNYMVTSGRGRVGSTAVLPGKLPTEADGYIATVGIGEASVYYRYVAADRLWEETAAQGTQTTFTNMPTVFTYNKDTGKYVLATDFWEARQAGDTENNPDPHFVGRRITGIGEFQGRLVLLCGEYLHMSASNKPYRFYRSSVAVLKDDDPIEVASTKELDDELLHAVQYNSNLILFGRRTQAVVPGGTVLTPRNTMIDIAARHEVDTRVKPVISGRSLMFASYGAGYSRIWEVVPDDNITTYITPVDITVHIPSYIEGRIRVLIPSQHSNMLVAVAESGVLYINEYVWEGDEKISTSWHKWIVTGIGHIITGRFDGAKLHLLDANASGDWTAWSWETNSAAISESEKIPHLDKLVRVVAVQDGELTIPPQQYLSTDTEDIVLYIVEGVDTYIPSRPVSVRGSYGDGWVVEAPWVESGDVYFIGRPYLSILAPTRPVIRDFNDRPINTERAQLHKLTVGVLNTGEFYVDAIDTARTTHYADTAVRLYARELDAGKPLMASTPINIICRLDMRTAVVQFSTDGVYDLNIVTIEYGYRHNRRYRRG